MSLLLFYHVLSVFQFLTIITILYKYDHDDEAELGSSTSLMDEYHIAAPVSVHKQISDIKAQTEAEKI